MRIRVWQDDPLSLIATDRITSITEMVDATIYRMAVITPGDGGLPLVTITNERDGQSCICPKNWIVV